MANERVDYLDRVTQDLDIMVGKPVVRGTRIPVELVLEQLSYNLASGTMSRPSLLTSPGA